MTRTVFLLWLTFLLPLSGMLEAQPIDTWQTLPNAPIASRHNDVYFVNPITGWIVNGAGQIFKTMDGGATWTSKDMSSYAAGLIDVYFFHPDSGFAVGLTNADHNKSSGVILFTADGGQTWETRFTTTRTGEWCWKMTFPSRGVGYVSLQRNSRTPIYFLKTTDGGATWEEKVFSTSYYFVQGIGFITEEMGWIGGNSSFPTFGTTDGGDTWQSADFGSRVNRFRFLGDTLGYAVGRRVYKYLRQTAVSVARARDDFPAGFALLQNYPNPFNPRTTIRFVVPEPSAMTLTVVDVAGRRVKELVRQVSPSGNRSVVWDGRDDTGRPVGSGVYFYTLQAGVFRQTRKMLLLR